MTAAATDTGQESTGVWGREPPGYVNSVQEQSFKPLECSIPPELTIAEDRDRRRKAEAGAREQSARRVRRRLAGLARR